MEVVCGGQDRVARSLDVTAEPIGPPRCRHELHRASRARCAVVAQLVESALDEVDGGEQVPGHAEAALRGPVVAKQRERRQRRARAIAAAVTHRRQPPELSLCGEVGSELRREVGPKPRQHGPGE
jgi:hypothetical protein